MPRTVALVTDSTASLPESVVGERGIGVVPLQVIIGGHAYEEGPEGGASPQEVADALRAQTPVSTSRPAPEAMLTAYRRAAEAGAEEVVSVHLSGEISGTVESAQLAARDSPVPVVVVDSRQVAAGAGFAVLTAADVLDAGGSAQDAAEAARARAAAMTALFYVDTLEHLRRGGRIGPAAALLGSALAVKPLLRIDDGRIVPHERVRTCTKALARLEELAVEAAGEHPADVAVAHLASPDRAAALADHLGQRLAENLEARAVLAGEVGAVLGAHVGPGMVAVVVAPRLPD